MKLDAHTERIEEYRQQYATLEVLAVNATLKASSDHLNVLYKHREKWIIRQKTTQREEKETERETENDRQRQRREEEGGEEGERDTETE